MRATLQINTLIPRREDPLDMVQADQLLFREFAACASVYQYNCSSSDAARPRVAQVVYFLYVSAAVDTESVQLVSGTIESV